MDQGLVYIKKKKGQERGLHACITAVHILKPIHMNGL